MSYSPPAFLSGKKVGYRVTATVFAIILAVLFAIIHNFIITGNQDMAILAMWGFWIVLATVVFVLWAMWISYSKYGRR